MYSSEAINRWLELRTQIRAQLHHQAETVNAWLGLLEELKYSSEYCYELLTLLLGLGREQQALRLLERWSDVETAEDHYWWRGVADALDCTGHPMLLTLIRERLRRSSKYASAPPTLPCLGVPVLNRPDLLLKMVDSLDFPIECLAVVDNSGGHPDVQSAIASIKDQRSSWVRQVEVSTPFRNLGVAASWNAVLRAFPDSPYWLLVNNDVQFTPGALALLHRVMNSSRAQLVSLLPDPQFFSCFAVTPALIDQVGWFDEHFFPAYCEDVEFRARVDALADQVEVIDLSPQCFPMVEQNTEQSLTIASDPDLLRQNLRTYELNRLRLLVRRWGWNLDDLPLTQRRLSSWTYEGQTRD